MIGIYHSKDFDGITSGVIMKMKYPDIKLVGYDRGDDIEKVINLIDDSIIIADISFDMDIMYSISKKADLLWIDHHKTSIDAFNSYPEEIKCRTYLDMSEAACVNTWKCLFPDKEIPYALFLIGCYDIWRFNGEDVWYNEIMPLQHGLKLSCDSPENFPLNIMHSRSDTEKMISENTNIVKYQQAIDRRICEKTFVRKVEGYSALCINGSGYSSDTFVSVFDPEKHDLIMWFSFDGEVWAVGLRTPKDDVDVSAIASKYGGGGHKKASGCAVDDIQDIINIK